MTDGRIDPVCVNTELSDVIQKLDVTVLIIQSGRNAGKRKNRIIQTAEKPIS